MTDNEIITALGHCSNTRTCPGEHEQCPYANKDECINALCRDTLELINRQKAEIERLTARNFELSEKGEKVCIALKNHIAEDGKKVDERIAEVGKTIKAEAVKEFAERLKLRAYTECSITGYKYQVIQIEEIDDLLKEMVGEDK